MTPSHEKGTKHETWLKRFLQEDPGWPNVERLGNQGTFDRGDFAGIIGICIQQKTGDRRLEIPDWMRATETQRKNAGAMFGILSVKPRGLGEGNVGDWWAIKPWQQEKQLLKLAGF
jgi:hypothetical protein